MHSIFCKEPSHILLADISYEVVHIIPIGLSSMETQCSDDFCGMVVNEHESSAVSLSHVDPALDIHIPRREVSGTEQLLGNVVSGIRCRQCDEHSFGLFDDRNELLDDLHAERECAHW